MDDFWADADNAYHPQPSRPADVFRTFFDRSGMRAAHLDDKLRVVEASVDFVRDFGSSAQELRGQSLPELLHPSMRTQVVEQFHRLMADRRLTRHWRLTSFDLPWHGKSPPPAGAAPGSWRLDTERYVGIIMQAIRAAGLRRDDAAPLQRTLVATVGAVLASAFVAFPYLLLNFGTLYPNGLAYTMLPAGVQTG